MVIEKTISCSYNRDIYHNPENGFTIAVYQPVDTFRPEDSFTAKGKILPRTRQSVFNLTGECEEDTQNRETFVVSSTEFSTLNNEKSIIGYLSSGLFKGIGPETAKAIYHQFGSESVNIVENRPEELLSVKGITEDTLAEISKSYETKLQLSSLYEYLGDVKITDQRANSIVESFGKKTVEVMENHIYRLTTISGFGFKTVDDLAEKLHRPLDCIERVQAGAVHQLKEEQSKGHLCQELDQFLLNLAILLNTKDRSTHVSESQIRKYILDSCKSKSLIYYNNHIYLPNNYFYEKKGSQLLVERISGKHTLVPSFIHDIPDVTLSREQENAVYVCIENPISLLTGFPGSGKTTVLKSIIHNLKEFYPKLSICLAAPTGRAAKRMQESTGHFAATIHSHFNLGPAMLSNRTEESDAPVGVTADVIIIDEFSMVDMRIFYEILNKSKSNAKLILVGDPNQLPSVDAGNVFSELLKTVEIPMTQLNQIFRSKDGSSIMENTFKIYEGDTDLTYDNRFRLFPANDDTDAFHKVVKLYHLALKQCGDRTQIAILSAKKSSGECCCKTINEAIQESLCDEETPYIRLDNRVLYLGDIVLQTKNNNELGIMNGDMGKIVSIDADGIGVQYPDKENAIIYDKKLCGQITLGYCITIHKSQGSEYPYVILPLTDDVQYMMYRNLLYTAVSRAKVGLFIIGSKSMLIKAIKTQRIDKRKTFFAEQITSVLKQNLGADKYTSTEQQQAA